MLACVNNLRKVIIEMCNTFKRFLLLCLCKTSAHEPQLTALDKFLQVKINLTKFLIIFKWRKIYVFYMHPVDAAPITVILL